MPSDDPDIRTYAVTGELFFASSNDLIYQFDYTDAVSRNVIDLSAAHIWDASTVATLDAITTKFQAKGTTVTIEGPQRQQRTTPPQARRSPRLSDQLAAMPCQCAYTSVQAMHAGGGRDNSDSQNLDPEIHQKLREQAAAHGRSWKPGPRPRYSGRRGTPDDQPGRSVAPVRRRRRPDRRQDRPDVPRHTEVQRPVTFDDAE